MMRKLNGRRVCTGTAAILAASTGVAAQTPAKSPQTIDFKIPAGTLQTVLAEFQRLTRMQVVLADPAIATIQSPGVTGRLTAERALEALLYGTRVTSKVTGETARIEFRAVSEFVAVTGEEKVASPKYRAPLVDTPQTVAIIPQQVFEQQSATNLREVLRNTPGITMSIGEGGSGGTSSGDNVLIRGFSARNDIYIDGTRDVGLVSRDSYNVESVEVAKGPSSVTAGRGATGGSINMVTKTASLWDSASVRLTAGTAENRRTTFDVNRKLSGNAAFRLNGMWQDSGYPGRDVAKYKRWGIAPSLALGLGTPTQVTLNYSRTQEDNIPDWGIPTLLPDVAIANHVTVDDLNFRNFYGIASRDYEKTTSDIGTATVTHKFNSRVTLRNLTRYGRNYRDAVLTPPRPVTLAAGQGSTDPGYNPAVAQIRRTDTKYQHRNDRVTTNQTDLQATFRTGQFQHDADFGAEFTHDHQPTYAFTDLFTFGRPPVDDLFTPTPYVAYTPAYAKTGASTDATAQTNAVYAFDTVKLGSRWQADLGIRRDHVNVDYTSVAATGVTTPFGRTDDATSGRVGLVFKPTARGSIYAAYSTSFSPSFDGTLGLTLAATGVNNQALPPEKTRNVEAGTKWNRDHIQFGVAAFQIEKTNAKTVNLNGATVLAGDQRVRGVEFNATGNITPRLGVFGGLSLMKGEVITSGIATEVGAELPYVPHVSMNVWSTYKMANGITLGGGVNYESGHYFNQTGGFLFVSGSTAQPKYVENAAAIQALTEFWTVSAMASYPVNKHLTLQLNGTNLGNTKYADRAYDRHFLPGPARQFLLSPVITW